MANFYDAEEIEGATYTVECVSDKDGHSTVHLPIHSKANLSFYAAKQFQIMRERDGFNAVIRRWA
jgi:hypothetical protein